MYAILERLIGMQLTCTNDDNMSVYRFHHIRLHWRNPQLR